MGVWAYKLVASVLRTICSCGHGTLRRRHLYDAPPHALDHVAKERG